MKTTGRLAPGRTVPFLVKPRSRSENRDAPVNVNDDPRLS
jgi:hypothetical protein